VTVTNIKQCFIRIRHESVFSAVWNSSVSTAMGWTTGVKIPVGVSFLSPPQHPDRLWGPPSLQSNRYRKLFPRGLKPATQFYLESRSRMVELYLHSDKFTFTFRYHIISEWLRRTMRKLGERNSRPRFEMDTSRLDVHVLELYYNTKGNFLTGRIIVCCPRKASAMELACWFISCTHSLSHCLFPVHFVVACTRKGHWPLPPC
jgi:hypothetical protein